MIRKYHLEIFVAVALVLFVGWYSYDSHYVSHQLQKSVVVPLEIDVGVVAPGKSQKFQISIRNNGSRTFRLEKIATTCGCLLAGIDRPMVPSKSVIDIPFSFVAPFTLGEEEKVVMLRADSFHNVAWFVTVKADVFADFWSNPHTIRFVSSSVKSPTGDSVQNTKKFQVTSSQSLPILSALSDLPFLQCEILSQQDGVGQISVTMDSNSGFVDNKEVTGNIVVKYGDEEGLQFYIPVTISPPRCCRIIAGDMQLNYSKRNKEPISRRVAILANGQLLPHDLVFLAIPDWLEITKVEHDGQYAYVTLEYSVNRLPSSWQGDLFEVSASGHFAPVILRGTVYQED